MIRYRLSASMATNITETKEMRYYVTVKGQNITYEVVLPKQIIGPESDQATICNYQFP